MNEPQILIIPQLIRNGSYVSGKGQGDRLLTGCLGLMALALRIAARQCMELVAAPALFAPSGEEAWPVSPILFRTALIPTHRSAGWHRSP